MDVSRLAGGILSTLIIICISTPILFALKMWAYNTTVKGMRKARKKRLKNKPQEKKHFSFFLLDQQRIRAPKRYVIYYYGYLLMLMVVVLFAWLTAYQIILAEAFQWIWVFKYLLDAIIGFTYIRQPRLQK